MNALVVTKHVRSPASGGMILKIIYGPFDSTDLAHAFMHASNQYDQDGFYQIVELNKEL